MPDPGVPKIARLFDIVVSPYGYSLVGTVRAYFCGHCGHLWADIDASLNPDRCVVEIGMPPRAAAQSPHAFAVRPGNISENRLPPKRQDTTGRPLA